MILPIQQVLKFSHDLEFGIISFWFCQVQHSPSAPRKPRADSPLKHVWSQTLFTNSPCIFLTIILQLADHALSELSGQPNVAIPSYSSQPSIPVGSNLEEIRLKQVSVLPLSGFNIPLFLSAILIPSPFQAQDSPDNSLFSFQIGATSQEKGEEATSADSVVLSDEIKAKLQQSLQFLNQDIG